MVSDARSMWALGGLLLVCTACAGAWGAVDVGFFTLVASALGFVAEPTSLETQVLLHIRAPRIVLAGLVGAGLGASGATLQSVFRNPLADPGLIGVSAGAMVGVVAWLVFASFLPWRIPQHPAILPAVAFGGGVASTTLVLRLSRVGGRVDVPTMLLAGIAINAIAAAVVGLAIYVADEEALRTVTLWTLGSFAAADWLICAVVGVVTAVALAFLLTQHRVLDLLLLGEREARHLGIEVTRARRRLVAAAALLVTASVGFTGMIGFVGLVVPHLVRLVLGPANRRVVPGSILLGASLLVLTDGVARTVVVPAELPVGVVTALVGGPFFLLLLVRNRAWRSL